MQLFVLPKNQVFLIDVFVLHENAFRTPNRSKQTCNRSSNLRWCRKFFFDVRNDADALFAHFQISMRGVHDIQLLEVATRSFPKEKLIGLRGCIESDAQLTAEAKGAWKATKQRGYHCLRPSMVVLLKLSLLDQCCKISSIIVPKTLCISLFYGISTLKRSLQSGLCEFKKRHIKGSLCRRPYRMILMERTKP